MATGSPTVQQGQTTGSPTPEPKSLTSSPIATSAFPSSTPSQNPTKAPSYAQFKTTLTLDTTPSHVTPEFQQSFKTQIADLLSVDINSFTVTFETGSIVATCTFHEPSADQRSPLTIATELSTQSPAVVESAIGVGVLSISTALPITSSSPSTGHPNIIGHPNSRTPTTFAPAHSRAPTVSPSATETAGADDAAQSDESIRQGVVVGSCVAAGAILAAITGYYIRRHRRNKNTKEKARETDSNSSSSETHLPMGMASPSAIALARRSLARQSWHTSTSTLESGDQDLLSSGAAGVDKGSVPVGGGLPADWLAAKTDDGTAYYFNTLTGESRWNLPAMESSPEKHPAKNDSKAQVKNDEDCAPSIDPIRQSSIVTYDAVASIQTRTSRQALVASDFAQTRSGQSGESAEYIDV